MSSRYDDIRRLVEDGDLVAVKSRTTQLARITQAVTRSPFTHTAIALWLDEGLFVAEMWGGGLACVPLSQYRHEAFEVFDCPVERAAVRRHILEHLRDGVDYDGWDLVRILANRVLGWPLPEQDDERMVCSSLSAHAYLEVGWKPIFALPAVASPGDVVHALSAPPKAVYFAHLPVDSVLGT